MTVRARTTNRPAGVRQLRTWLTRSPLVLALFATACGSPPAQTADPDASLDASADADVVSCTAAAITTPSPQPSRIQLDAARTFRAGPVGLPETKSQKFGVVTQRRPTRSNLFHGKFSPRVAQRTLLLTAVEDQPSYGSALAALQRIGVPHETHVATTTAFSALRLFDYDGTCRFSSVILATDMLGYYDEINDQFISALTVEEWEMINSYELVCGVREAIWYAYPQADLGMGYVSNFDDTEVEHGKLTAEGEAIFPYLADQVEIPFQDAWGYRGTILSPTTTSPLVTTAGGDVLVVKHTRDDGIESIVMTVDSATYSLHAQLLEYGVVNWLQRGLFLGERRVYLTAQMDDIYLNTDLWKIGASSAEESDSTYRMTAADVSALVSWQQGLQSRLPEGSSFATQMPFNGVGTLPSVEPDTSLVTALDAAKDEFDWISHTWDHEDMDEMSLERAKTEMRINCLFASENAISRFDCNSAVTPHVSGLDNPDAVAGMLFEGVRFVVSDTSVTATLRPGNPGTNPSHNVGRRNPSDPALFQVPRHPTNIFYSTSLKEEQVDLYNFLYRSWHGRDLSYDEILDEEVAVALSYLATYDIDPLMFHQANLRFWTDAGPSSHSLYTDWVDRVVDRYLSFLTLPILTLPLAEIGQLMQQREAYDLCGVNAVIVSDEGGRRLEISSTGSCKVPVTGLAAPSAGQVQEYGGATTTFVESDACETQVIPLDEGVSQ